MKMAPNRKKADHLIWFSNNKVLVGGGNKKHHARNPNFDTDETKLLISLWGDPKVQKTLITTHKKSPVIAKLAQEMKKHGYLRSPEEINTRIKNLKCLYNRIKKEIETGACTSPTWKHYKAMDEILNRPIFGRSAAEERMRLYQEKLLKEQIHQQKQSSPQVVILKSQTQQQNLQNSKPKIEPDDNIEVVDDDELDFDNDDEDDDDDDDDDDDFLDEEDDDIDDDDEDANSSVNGKIDDYNFPMDMEEDFENDEENIDENNFYSNKKSKDLKINDKPDHIPISTSSVTSTTDTSTKTITTATTTSTTNINKSNTITSNSIPIIPASEIKIEEPLIVPKEEPIDLDEMEIDESQLGEHHGFSISVTDGSASTVNTTSTVISTSQSSSLLKINQAPPLVSTSSTPGKISLVPANILLKSHSQNVQVTKSIPSSVPPKLTFAPQQILYTNQQNTGKPVQNTIQQAKVIQQTHTGIQMNSSTGMPMQVLLVNRVPQNQSTPVTVPVCTSNSVQQTQSFNINKTILNPPVTRTPPQQSKSLIIKKLPKPLPPLSLPKLNSSNQKSNDESKKVPNFRSMLKHLVYVEKANLEVNRKRLLLEQERLDFEKSVARKIISALRFLQPKTTQNTTSSNETSSMNSSNDSTKTEENSSQGISDN